MRFDFKVSSKTFIILLGAYFAFMMNLSFWRFFFKNIEEHSLMNYVFLTTIIINVFLIYTLFFNLILWKGFERVFPHISRLRELFYVSV